MPLSSNNYFNLGSLKDSIPISTLRRKSADLKDSLLQLSGKIRSLESPPPPTSRQPLVELRAYHPNIRIPPFLSMPYVESVQNNMSSEAMTNGDRPASLFISHLKGYPVVNDAVTTYKTNQYGAKSLDLAQLVYVKLGLPVLPYLRTPYSIVAPYLSKADTLADSGLTKVDERFPVVKEETSAITDTVKGYAFYPVTVAGQGKEYLFTTYDDEYKKTGGDKTMVHTAKALLSTELRLAFEAYGYVTGYLGKKKEDVQQKANEKQ